MATIEGTLASAGRQYGEALGQMGMVPQLVLQSFARLLEDIEDRKMRREQMLQQESQFSRNLAEMVNERRQRALEAEAGRKFAAEESRLGRETTTREAGLTRELQRELSGEERKIQRETLTETSRLHDMTQKLQERIQALAEKTQDTSQKEFLEKMAQEHSRFMKSLDSRREELEFDLGEKAASRIATQQAQEKELASREKIAGMETAASGERANQVLYAQARDSLFAEMKRISSLQEANLGMASPTAQNALSGLLSRLQSFTPEEVGGPENLTRLKEQVHAQAKNEFPAFYQAQKLRDLQEMATSGQIGPTLISPKTGTAEPMMPQESRSLETEFRKTSVPPASYRGATMSPQDSSRAMEALGQFMRGLSEKYQPHAIAGKPMEETPGVDPQTALSMEALSQYLQPSGQPVQWTVQEEPTGKYGLWAPRGYAHKVSVDLTEVLDEIRRAQLQGEPETAAALRLLERYR